MQTIKVKNPILRGFNPDPNILRVERAVLHYCLLF